jgi:flagellar P-ring protein precursor FlgI
MAALEELAIEPSASAAKVILNSRTGSVVMNQSVRLAPSAVAHGNLTVRIQSNPEVSQPGAFSRGETVVTSQDTATVSSDGKPDNLIAIPGGAALASVVKALNMLGATPSDLISILQSLKSAGALSAEIEVI